MITSRFLQFRQHLALALFLGLIACAPAHVPTEMNDPNEAANRRMHKFNKTLDRNLLKPVSGAYGTITRGPVADGIDNFASNLSLLGMIVNDFLQFEIGDAFSNTIRFAFNSTVGIGGFVDVAGRNGIYEQKTDFGETLHRWGVGEGKYIELPLFGASTERDTAGLIVDFVLDPLNYILPASDRYIGTGAYVLNKVGDRDRYSDLIESVLYESEDSYAQSRLLYLQSRRRSLRGEVDEDDLEDPYAE